MLVLSDCNGADTQVTFDQHSWTIKTSSGECLSAAQLQSGASLQLGEECTNWGYDDNTGRIFHCMDDSCDDAFCVDLPGGNSAAGTVLWLWECVDGVEGQSWSFQDGSMGVAFV